MSTIRTERLTKVGSNDLPTQRPSDTLDDIDTVCAGLAGYILADAYEREDWQDSPFLPALKRLAEWLKADGRELPPELAEVLKKAGEATVPLAVAAG
jgi:hypothetical protein